MAVLDQKTVVKPRDRVAKTACVGDMERILIIRNITPKHRAPQKALNKLTLNAWSPRGIWEKRYPKKV